MNVQGTVNMSATYNTRNNDIESSVVARGDLWRLEASRSGSTSGNDTSPLYLVQLGPLLFVRDSTLLLPVHLSKQHLLWYGYDRKVHILYVAFSQYVKPIHSLFGTCFCFMEIHVLFVFLYATPYYISWIFYWKVVVSYAEWSAFPLPSYLVETEKMADDVDDVS